MKIKITRAIFIEGVAADVGDVVDVSDKVGAELIGTNSAESAEPVAP